MPRLRKDDSQDIKFYTRALLRKMGKDFTKCEQCGEDITGKGKAEIHHTKYEGAIIYDLQVVCRKCNLKPENTRLK